MSHLLAALTADGSSSLEQLLTFGSSTRPPLEPSAIQRETRFLPARDGVRLATDFYFPPTLPAPVIALRTPYGRTNATLSKIFLTFARHGYIALTQDCRGTGESEPQRWDYYVYEAEDGYDLVDWVARQDWFGGFLGGCGGSYAGQTQWCMAVHPAMSAIAPEVSGLGLAVNTAHLHLFLDAYARAVGKGDDKLNTDLAQLERETMPETLAGGLFDAPLYARFSRALFERYPMLHGMRPFEAQRWLWERYCGLSSAERASFVKTALERPSVTIAEVEALSTIFGPRVPHDAHTLPNADPDAMCRSLYAPALMITGWYDWSLNDALATWERLRRAATDTVRTHTRLIITPAAHQAPGYREDIDCHPALSHAYRLEHNVPLLLEWYAAIRRGDVRDWPPVIYYLMGANEWRTASDWPPPQVQPRRLYLASGGALNATMPCADSPPDSFVYDPLDPTPTVGGSILSFVYTPGSCDVSAVQDRSDVLCYTSEPFAEPMDVVGPLRFVLHASSSAPDTDFCVRVSDVFPDGRAIQLQSGILRARYRNLEPEWLEPGCVYELHVDLWATANRFHAGHRLRADLSSADFPRFDRNANRAAQAGPPLRATQTIYHDAQHPSHLLFSVLPDR